VTNFDPASTMNAVDEGAAKLEAASEVISAAVMDFENAEEAFELEMAKLRLEADRDAKDGKPSQGRRHDLALTALHERSPEVYTAYFAAKAVKEAKQVKLRALSAAVSARQSVLKAVNP
jgi:hypothetical protein